MTIAIWILDIIGAAYLFIRMQADRYGISIAEYFRELKEERELRKTWKKEMG